MSMSMSMSLNAKMSEKLVSGMKSLIEEATMEAVRWCGEHYNFDAEEALRNLSVNIDFSTKTKSKSKSNTSSEKAKFVLPYHGKRNDDCCSGLRKNVGLYTQCQVQKKVNDNFCKTCQNSADKNDGIPEYGTIEQRQAVDPFEYVDPKGRKPTSYAKIMKKLNLSREEVLAEAERLNIVIDEKHFEEEEEEEVKRGRPKVEKPPKEPKGAKGRPKKTQKVVEVNDDTLDLFASMVNDIMTENNLHEEVEEVKKTKKGKLAEERLKEKEEKEALRLKEKEEKEALRQKQKEEKEAKKKANEEAKAERLKEKQEAKTKKSANKKAKEPEPEEEEEQEQDVVKKIEVDGVKYLKSKKTGIIYDYNSYTELGCQVILGQWNDDKNIIEFDILQEEEDEEEDEEVAENDDEEDDE